MKRIRWDEDALWEASFSMKRSIRALGQCIDMLSRLRRELQQVSSRMNGALRNNQAEANRLFARLKNAEAECARLERAIQRANELFSQAERDSIRLAEQTIPQGIFPLIDRSGGHIPVFPRTFPPDFRVTTIPFLQGIDSVTIIPLHLVMNTPQEFFVPEWLSVLSLA